MRWRERRQKMFLRERRSLDFHRRDIDATCGIDPLSPKRFAVAIQRYRPRGHLGDIFLIDMELDFQPVWPVLGGLVKHDVATRNQKQSVVALKKKPASIRQWRIPQHCRNSRASTQQRL